VAALGLAAIAWRPALASPDDDGGALNARLAAVLDREGFTGRIESTLERRLGRPIDARLADLGRLLWFDTLHSLRHDNTCGGCHSPTNGFGDSQGMAIGVQNNGLVGPDRAGPRNQRRSPLVVNTAFLPALMWNGRFSARSGDPFDNTLGFHFPPPEADAAIHRHVRRTASGGSAPPSDRIGDSAPGSTDRATRGSARSSRSHNAGTGRA